MNMRVCERGEVSRRTPSPTEGTGRLGCVGRIEEMPLRLVLCPPLSWSPTLSPKDTADSNEKIVSFSCSRRGIGRAFDRPTSGPRLFCQRVEAFIFDTWLMLTLLQIEVQRTGYGEGGEGTAGAKARIAEECILHYLEARRELLHACLALRDALTTKEQKRRLQALAKLRAEKAEKAEKAEQLKGEKDRRRQEDEEDARPEGKALDLDQTSIKPVAPGASTALGADEAGSSLAGVGSTGVELDTDGRVQAAAVGLAALTTADVAEEAEGGEGGGGLGGKSGSSPGSSGVTVKDASGGQGRADFGSSDTVGASRDRVLLDRKSVV